MRPICPKCEFIIERCLCDHLYELTSPIPIIILRDPKEKNHPLGTVQLLKKCLKNVTVIDTDDPDNHVEFIAILENVKRAILIYPFENSRPLTEVNTDVFPDCIIFLDGTWKKTNRLFFRSKKLQKIPRFHLDLINFKTNYRLRKSSKENSLSTLEAVEFTLNQLFLSDFSKLSEIFSAFIDKQIELMNKKKGV